MAFQVDERGAVADALALHPVVMAHDRRAVALRHRDHDDLHRAIHDHRARATGRGVIAMARRRPADPQASAIREIGQFAVKTRQDEAAVRAGCILSWSNGQTEGQVTRLKFLKRQMYGRAGFDLLRKRVLATA